MKEGAEIVGNLSYVKFPFFACRDELFSPLLGSSERKEVRKSHTSYVINEANCRKVNEASAL